MSRVVITISDRASRAAGVNVSIEFDPPIRDTNNPTPAQAAAMQMLNNLEGEAERVRVRGADKDGQPATIEVAPEVKA